MFEKVYCVAWAVKDHKKNLIGTFSQAEGSHAVGVCLFLQYTVDVHGAL